MTDRRLGGAPGSLTVQRADKAFDGQFFYRIGVAPWSRNERVAGVQFDLPALRNARWGYGALAFVASGGDANVVPWALVGLNVAAMAAVGAVGGALARSSGRHAAWGALLALWPGFAYSLSLDTSELVASAFALAALLALRHQRWIWSAGLLVAAVITRDTTAVIPAGVVMGAAWSWGRKRADRTAALRAGVVGAAGLVVFVGWQLLQRSRFGTLPLTSSGDSNLSAPFTGLIHELRDAVPPGGGDEAFRLLAITGLIVLIGVAGWCWRRTTASVAERAAWLPAVAVVVFLNAYLWSGATAFLRATTEAGVLSILVILGTRRDRLLLVAGVALGGLWFLTAASQVAKLP